ncbi:MAG: helix-turn-helix transcriptional regulator [Treponema sp.]|nr:helix-turn-helix transcriptional regulator [Treponema sp.]
MIIFPLGQILKSIRKSKKRSQIEVSHGLCSIASLSRIESGQQMPSRKLAESLFSRLGTWFDERQIPMTTTEFRRWQIEKKFRREFCQNNFLLDSLLDEYASLSEMEPLEKQTHIFLSAILKGETGHDTKEILEMLFEAIDITQENFTEDFDVEKNLFTKTELILINNIALEFYQCNETERAIKLLKKVMSYYEMNEIDKTEYNENVPTILFNLSNWIGLNGDFSEAYNLAQKGAVLCKDRHLLYYLPRFVFNMGYTLCKLGKKDEGELHINRSLEIMNAMGLENEVKELVPEVKTLLGIDVWNHIA